MAEQDDIAAERWLPVVGWEGYYEVSDLGRVRRVAPYHGYPAGRLVAQCRTKSGLYPRVGLSTPEKRCTYVVHRLVLEAFVGLRPAGHEARHTNGDGWDNRLTNLSWSTHAENIGDKQQHGTNSRGERHGAAKLTDEQAAMVRQRLSRGERQLDIASDLGVNKNVVWRIANGKSWR